MDEEKKTSIVKHPVREWPNYELREGATPEEMRAMAVKAMRDELTFEWTPREDFTYRKTGAVSKKLYEFHKDTVYQGLPYSSGGTSLLHWLQYYDTETGEFFVENDPDFMWKLGNSCAASADWGISAVCSSMRDGVSSYYFVYQNNFYPLGDVKYPGSVTNFKYFASDKIVEANGPERVLEGYALAHAGDVVLSTDAYETQFTARHVMMVTEDAVVVRNADGSINAEKSYITEQDQRAKDAVYETEDPEYSVVRRGRLDHQVSFADLLKKYYIALTTLEFQGIKPYEVGFAEWGNAPTDVESLLSTTVRSNYRIVYVKLTFTDENGKKTEVKHVTTDNFPEEDGLASAIPVSECFRPEDLKNSLEKGEKYNCEGEVLLASGGIRALEAFEFIA